MHVLFLCNSLDIGGIERYIINFINWANNKEKLNFTIICKSGKKGCLYQKALEVGARVITINMGYVNIIGFYKFYKLIKRNKYDALCDFGGDFGAIPIFLSYLVGIKRRCVFYRNSDDMFKKTRLKIFIRRGLNRIVRRYSIYILSNSKAAFNYFYNNYEFHKDKRFKIIKNGVPVISETCYEEVQKIKNRYGIRSDHKIILNVGNARPAKNQIIILRVAKQAYELGLNNWLFIILGADVIDSYRGIVIKENLNNVLLIDRLSNVQSFYKLADVFLFPSLSEGQPNALIEAIINGLPFVASEIEPIRELFPEYWRNQWLVPPNDCSKIIETITDHLNKQSKEDPKFLQLIQFIKKEHNPDKCFYDFFKLLVN